MLLAGMYDSVVLEGTSSYILLRRACYGTVKIHLHLGQTEPLWTFTIVTTDANKQLSWLHERMPVILSTKAEVSSWLDCTSGSWSADLSKLVLPYNNRNRALDCYAVPTDVGKVGAESSTFVEPIAQRKDGIQAMFAKQRQAKTISPMSTPSSSQVTSKNIEKKRKRSTSPPLLLNDTKDEENINDGLQSQPSKALKLNTWEDDSEIEYISSTAPKKDPGLETSQLQCVRRTICYWKEFSTHNHLYMIGLRF